MNLLTCGLFQLLYSAMQTSKLLKQYVGYESETTKDQNNTGRSVTKDFHGKRQDNQNQKTLFPSDSLFCCKVIK